MREASNRPIYGAPTNTKSKRSAKGRTCDHAGCTTVLSTYNASTTCWLHTPPGYRHALARS
jgi:arginine repressor